MGKVASRASRAGSGLSKVASKVAGAVRRGCSFSAETLVATPDGGQQAIASLQEGDQVEAYDPETGTASAQTVEHVWINHDNDLIDLTLRSDADSQALAHPADMSTKQQEAEVASHGLRAPPATADEAAPPATTAETLETLETLETIHTTSEHPWLTANRGWVAAGNLQAGERVRRLDGSTATIIAVPVVRGFRDYVLAYPSGPGGWGANNWPLKPEQTVTSGSIEPGNASIGPGSRQDFRYRSLGWTAARNVYVIYSGQDLLALESQLAAANQHISQLEAQLSQIAPPTPPDPKAAESLAALVELAKALKLVTA